MTISYQCGRRRRGGIADSEVEPCRMMSVGETVLERGLWRWSKAAARVGLVLHIFHLSFQWFINWELIKTIKKEQLTTAWDWLRPSQRKAWSIQSTTTSWISANLFQAQSAWMTTCISVNGVTSDICFRCDTQALQAVETGASLLAGTRLARWITP